MPLSDVAIRSAKPATKPLKMSDGGGLYLLLNPTGSRWWRLDYRFGGKRKTLSMGTYPDTGLKDARQRRDAARTHRVSQAIAKTMTEVDIKYPNSPLNGATAKRGPQPGDRMAPVLGDFPFGAGSQPMFTLCGVPSADLTALAKRFPNLVDPITRAPIADSTISLVRPDGYLVASSASIADIAAKLEGI